MLHCSFSMDKNRKNCVIILNFSGIMSIAARNSNCISRQKSKIIQYISNFMQTVSYMKRRDLNPSPRCTALLKQRWIERYDGLRLTSRRNCPTAAWSLRIYFPHIYCHWIPFSIQQGCCFLLLLLSCCKWKSHLRDGSRLPKRLGKF